MCKQMNLEKVGNSGFKSNHSRRRIKEGGYIRERKR